MSSSVKSTAMCTCDQNDTEEYHTAFSDFETSTPEEWRNIVTSTRYYEEDIAPEYQTSPRRIVRRERGIPRTAPRTRRLDLTAGVAIVPRRIDFDATSEAEDFDEEDLGETRETLQRLRSVEQRSTYESPPTYRLRHTRRTQYPEYKRQLPRMTRVTPCGKCLRI